MQHSKLLQRKKKGYWKSTYSSCICSAIEPQASKNSEVQPESFQQYKGRYANADTKQRTFPCIAGLPRTWRQAHTHLTWKSNRCTGFLLKHSWPEGVHLTDTSPVTTRNKFFMPTAPTFCSRVKCHVSIFLYTRFLVSSFQLLICFCYRINVLWLPARHLDPKPQIWFGVRVIDETGSSTAAWKQD